MLTNATKHTIHATSAGTQNEFKVDISTFLPEELDFPLFSSIVKKYENLPFEI